MSRVEKKILLESLAAAGSRYTNAKLKLFDITALCVVPVGFAKCEFKIYISHSKSGARLY